jgi:ADP-ribose pyrophosphatase YjhB (NUDIX family)
MIVGCLVIQDGKVLLAKRNIEPRKGYWNLPCGFLENNETAADGAVRETWEECLANVKIDDLHCVYDLIGVHQVYLIFNAHMINDSIGVTPESSEVAFLSPDEIPWDEIAFASSKFALNKWIASKGTPDTKVHLGSFHKFAGAKKASEKDK